MVKGFGEGGRVRIAEAKRIAREHAIADAKTRTSCELSYYADTGNGAHVWAAYAAWRELARFSKLRPPAIPAAISIYFDEIAAGLMQLRGTRSLGRLLKLSGKKPYRGGGPSGAHRAALHRKAVSVRTELIIQLRRAAEREPVSRGTMKDVIAAVARQETMSVSAVRTMVSRGQFMDAAKSAVLAAQEYRRSIGSTAAKRIKVRAGKRVARLIAALDTLRNTAGSPTK